MSKFNSKVDNSVTTYEGGKGYKRNSLEAFMNFLFSSYLEDQFYEDANTQMKRFQELTQDVIKDYGPAFVCKCSVFSRKILGMRSASQFVAAMLNAEQFENKRHFFASVANRPDDVAEIFAAIDMLGNKRSHAAVRGFSDYLSTLGEYQIGKYQLKGKQYNMFDLINITHVNSAAIDKYKNGALEAPDTWEVNISDASKSKEERQAEWLRMVDDGKLGYMALIRNLNNILEAAPTQGWIEESLIPQLINENKIRKSLVFPYRLFVAYKNLACRNLAVIAALEKAFRIAVKNMPVFNGKTCIILDVSASMGQYVSCKSNISVMELSACYAAALYLKNPDVDIVKFGAKAKMMDNLNPLDNVFNIIQALCRNDNCGHCTATYKAFELISNINYDRIILFSDMQVMASRYYNYSESGIDGYNSYCRAHGRTKLYSFDLGNYSSQIAPSSNPDVHLMTSLNDTIVSMIPYVENGAKLFDIINSMEY